MKRIAVACVAGASSTFLARRLSEIANANDLDLTFTPLPVEQIHSGQSELVAITSHVATKELLETLSDAGIAHIVLDETVRGGFGAERAISQISAFFEDNGSQPGFTVEIQKMKDVV